MKNLTLLVVLFVLFTGNTCFAQEETRLDKQLHKLQTAVDLVNEVEYRLKEIEELRSRNAVIKAAQKSEKRQTIQLTLDDLYVARNTAYELATAKTPMAVTFIVNPRRKPTAAEILLNLDSPEEKKRREAQTKRNVDAYQETVSTAMAKLQNGTEEGLEKSRQLNHAVSTGEKGIVSQVTMMEKLFGLPNNTFLIKPADEPLDMWERALVVGWVQLRELGVTVEAKFK